MLKKTIIAAFLALAIFAGAVLSCCAESLDGSAAWGTDKTAKCVVNGTEYERQPFYEGADTDGIYRCYYALFFDAGSGIGVTSVVYPDGLSNVALPYGSKFDLSFDYLVGGVNGVACYLKSYRIRVVAKRTDGSYIDLVQEQYSDLEYFANFKKHFNLSVSSISENLTLQGIVVEQHYVTTIQSGQAQMAFGFGNVSYTSLTQEEQKADSAGNSAASDVTGAIPADTSGVTAGIQSFVQAMAYDGTAAKWTFPALYLPAIPGVMERIELTAEQDIDFGVWVQQIPSGVLEIVQIVSTIALVLFCFKELYGMISYFLTLKGGSADE